MPAVSLADPGKEQAQIVVNFSGGGNRRTRIARAVFLPYGNGRRDAFDQVNVRLLDPFQKLPGIGGERFDIAALSLCIDGVKGQG